MFSNSGVLGVKILPATFKSVITASSNTSQAVHTFSITTTLSTEDNRAILVFMAAGKDGGLPSLTDVVFNTEAPSALVSGGGASNGTMQTTRRSNYWADSLIPSTAGTYDLKYTWSSAVDWCAVSVYEVYDVDQSASFSSLAQGFGDSYTITTESAGQVVFGLSVGASDTGASALSVTAAPTGHITDIDFTDSVGAGSLLTGHTTTPEDSDIYTIAKSGDTTNDNSFIMANGV